MNWTTDTPNLRFDRQSRTLRHRLAAVGLILAVFTLLWTIVPHGVLYWAFLPLITAMGWVASYGWRQALAVLITLLVRLEQRHNGGQR